MSDVEFTIRLAPGLYMDSMGRFISGPVDTVPTHPAPGGGIPFDPNTFKKSLTSISDSLAKTSDPKTKAALLDLGVPNEVIGLLGQIGEIAGTLAKVVPYVGAVLEIGKLLGIFKGGPDPVLQRIDLLWHQTATLIEAKDAKWTAKEIFVHKERVLAGLNKVAEYQEDLKPSSGVDPDILRARLIDLRNMHDDIFDNLIPLLAPSLWQSQLDGEHFKMVWAPNLFFDPGPGEPGTNQRAFIPGGKVDRFDHRVMAPIVSSMVQVYLTIIKQMVPEYRSSREFEESLSQITKLVEPLANLMRTQTLARTHWYPQDFAYLYPVQPTLFFQPPQPDLAGWHVGALDLRTESVPAPPNIPFGFNWILDHSGYPLQRGAMQFNWIPPAQVELEDHGNMGTRFRVLNPDECAKAANERSEELYAELLYSSGYLNLVHVIGLLRHVYTVPSKSENVDGVVSPSRSPILPRTTTTVTGAKVFPYPPATSTAEVERQTTFIRANVSTQPSERVRRFTYRIWLRTLNAKADGTSDYGSVYQTSYVDETTSPSADMKPFKKLVSVFAAEGVLDQKKLTADSKTPREIVTEGPETITLKADTFDWWIAVPSVVPSLPQMSGIFSDLRDAGVLTSHAQAASAPKPPAPTPAPGKWADAQLVNDYVYESPSIGPSEFVHAPSPAPIGERRDVKHGQEVKVTYSLTWNQSDLIVRVEGRPQDRNYDLYLVLEEMLPDETVLHTSFLIPVTGQLTFVPEKFFKEEQDLIDKSNDFWNDFNNHYTESRDLSPEDPIAQINWRDLRTVEGIERVARLVRTEQPEVLGEFMRTRGIELPQGERIQVS
jgi:hypothetical protein